MRQHINRFVALSTLILLSPQIFPVWAQGTASRFKIDPSGLPILEFGSLLTFMIRLIFIIAGLAALFYGLMGGIAWITSGGGKDEISAARDKIQAAIVGVFILIVVLTIIWTLETVVFKRSICFGISCDIKIPNLGITPIPSESCSDYCTRDAGIDYRNGMCKTACNTAANEAPAPSAWECSRTPGPEDTCCCIP